MTFPSIQIGEMKEFHCVTKLFRAVLKGTHPFVPATFFSDDSYTILNSLDEEVKYSLGTTSDTPGGEEKSLKVA